MSFVVWGLITGAVWSEVVPQTWDDTLACLLWPVSLLKLIGLGGALLWRYRWSICKFPINGSVMFYRSILIAWRRV
jgi:hypothetical protein